MKVKYKYRIGETVYCRPWLRWSGYNVYKVKVISRNHCAGSPYYNLELEKGSSLFIHVQYESELSKRPERLVREALKAIDEYYDPYIRAAKNYKNELKKLLRKK